MREFQEREAMTKTFGAVAKPAVPISQRLGRSKAARAAAMPIRAKSVLVAQGETVKRSARWLVSSREHHNYTYELTPRNRRHLAHWVAQNTGTSYVEVLGYFDELERDDRLREHIAESARMSPRRGLIDPDARYGRRLGWYALVRILRPAVIVETGTDKGLGSCVLAAALARNEEGVLFTIDIHPESGLFINKPYSDWIKPGVGDSVRFIEQLDSPVDIFLHDSWHSYEHETRELVAVEPKLHDTSVVLSDNATECDALLEWSESRGRNFAFFREQPQDHWYSGDGIGLSK